MARLPANAIHEARTCADCRRVMVTKAWAQDNPGFPEGLVVFYGHGRCRRCCLQAKRDGLLAAVEKDPNYALGLYRGPAMAAAATQRGYDRWVAARNHRLNAGARRKAAA